jgi:hypothetical protein
MKSRLFLYLVPLVALAGCDKIKDATAITVNTELQSNITVTVTNPVKSANGAKSLIFSETQDLSLADNSDLESYLSKINEIDLSNLVITITGLTTGQSISSISLDVAGVGTVFTQTDITMTSNSFTPTVSSTILGQMATKLKADNKLTFTISGSASEEMTFVVGCNMDAKVKVNTI